MGWNGDNRSKFPGLTVNDAAIMDHAESLEEPGRQDVVALCHIIRRLATNDIIISGVKEIEGFET